MSRGKRTLSAPETFDNKTNTKNLNIKNIEDNAEFRKKIANPRGEVKH